MKTFFPIESSFVYCLYVWKFTHIKCLLEEEFPKIVNLAEKEDFPSLQYICSQSFVSKLLTDYKDEKPKIVECYLGLGTHFKKHSYFNYALKYSKDMNIINH